MNEAEDATLRALQEPSADPLTRPRLFVTLGLVYRALDRRTNAQLAFEHALEAFEAHPFLSRDTEALRAVYGNLAELHVEEGSVATAIGMIEQLLIQYPEDSQDRPRILNWLGNCCAALGADTQARGYYEQVLATAGVRDEDAADARAGLAELPPRQS